MNRLPYVMMILIGAPLGCLWAVLTLPRHSRLDSGLGKMGLGLMILFLLILEWDNSLLLYCLSGLAALTALLGMVELIAAKVAIDRNDDSEQEDQVLPKGAPSDELST